MPNQVRSYLVPVSTQEIHKQILEKECRGITSKYKLDDLLSKLGISDQFNIYYDVIVPANSYLSKPALVKTFSFNGEDDAEYQVELKYEIEKEGLLTGIKGYFIAELTDGTILDISGDDIENRKTSDCWKHCYMPIKNPISVSPSDILQFNFSRFYPKQKDTPFRQYYQWKGKVLRGGQTIAEFEHGTNKVKS